MTRHPGKEVSWSSALIWFFGGLGLLVAMGVGVQVGADAQQAEWDAGTGTRRVQLSGVMAGDTYTLSSTAVVDTDAEYELTTLEVFASRIATRSTSRTPSVVVKFPNSNLTCWTGRNYVWSTEAGSTVTLACDRYVLLEDLDDLGAGSVNSRAG